MIILRQREFGRTGLTKDQAKEWFKGGQGKVNKVAKNLYESNLGNTKYRGFTRAKGMDAILHDPAKWITRLNQKPSKYGFYKDVDSLITGREVRGGRINRYYEYPPRYYESTKDYLSRIKKLKSEKDK